MGRDGQDTILKYNKFMSDINSDESRGNHPEDDTV